jgi:PIN domain nuclease of toxin-antitoxin system
VRLLLDSHALLWWLSDDERLSKTARDAIQSGEVYVSAITAYELGIKFKRGQLSGAARLFSDFEKHCVDEQFQLLSISAAHVLAAAAFGDEHGDPFDRLIAAQSLVENLAIVSIDKALLTFGCKLIW